MSDKNHTVVQITTGTIVRTLGVLLLFWVGYLLRDLLLALVSAVVLASAIEPGTRWFVKQGLPRVVSVLTIFILVFGIIGACVYFILPTFFRETSAFLSHLPQYVDSLQTFSEDFSFFSLDIRERLLGLFATNQLTSIGGVLSVFTGGLFQSAGFLFGGVFRFILIVVLSFYLSVQEHGIVNFLRLVTHERYEAYVIDLWHRSQNKIGRWMQGQLILGLLMGVFVYLGLTILGIKYQLLLAILAALLELIPVFGPIIAAVPAVAVAFGQSASLGFIVIGFYIVIQQFENHLIYPLVVQRIVGVPPMLVIISLIAGGELAGFLGILLSVPLATALFEVMTDFEKHKKRIPRVS